MTNFLKFNKPTSHKISLIQLLKLIIYVILMSISLYIISLYNTSENLYLIIKNIYNFWDSLTIIPSMQAEVELESYKIDKIIILPNELEHIKLNSLSGFMRMELLKCHIVKWNLQDLASVQIHLPVLTNETPDHYLSNLTYTIGGDLTPKNLKDIWPVNGGDLAFKPEEGLNLRRKLGLGLDQEIKYVTTKELPSLPTPLSTTTSLNCSLESLNESLLFYHSTADLVTNVSNRSTSSISSLLSDHCSVEFYHERRSSLQEYLNRPLPTAPYSEFNSHNSAEVSILNRRFTIHSEILEDSSEDLLDSSNYRRASSSRSSFVNTNCSTLPGYEVEANPYTVLPTYEESEIS